MDRKRKDGAAEIERIVDTHSDMLLRIALHQVNSYSEAEDILQTVFLRLLKSGFAATDPEHEKAWLIRVTINLCKDYLKSPKRQRTMPLEQYKDQPVAVYQKEEEHLMQLELLAAIKKLPAQFRDAIYLFYYEGLSVACIAQIMESKEGTVMSWLHRGRGLLKEELKGGAEA